MGMLGLGLRLAVLMDATLVRMVLLLAFTRWAWSTGGAPRQLTRLLHWATSECSNSLPRSSARAEAAVPVSKCKPAVRYPSGKMWLSEVSIPWRHCLSDFVAGHCRDIVEGNHVWHACPWMLRSR